MSLVLADFVAEVADKRGKLRVELGSDWSEPAQQAFLGYTLVRLVSALDPVLKLTVPRWQQPDNLENASRPKSTYRHYFDLLANTKLVRGHDSDRFPVVRGARRKGCSVEFQWPIFRRQTSQYARSLSRVSKWCSKPRRNAGSQRSRRGFILHVRAARLSDRFVQNVNLRRVVR
jgi:hypothetical protein